MFPLIMYDGILTGFPEGLAAALGAPLLAGQLIASSMVLMMMILPILFLTKKELPALVVGIVALGVDVGLGWLPAWMFILIMLITAGLIAGMFRGWLGGGH